MAFAPSVDAAAAALGSGTPLERREHPSGAKGAAVSFEEVAKKIREGRLDPRVRAWTGEVLIKAGKPKAVVDQARAILRAVRDHNMYVPDPVGAEMIVAAKNTLCLDDKGLCVRVADCDDLCVAVGSCLMSVGIPTKLIGQAFNGGTVPTHVLLAIDTPSGWKKIDPSHRTYDVGEAHPATKEWEIDPMDTDPVGLSAGMGGDFVGVGALEPSDAGDPVYAKLRNLIDGLESSLLTMQKAALQTEQANLLLRGQKFDPEPYAINSIAQFPTTGIWTARMSELSGEIAEIGLGIVAYGRQALAGLRSVLVDSETGEAAIGAKPNDPWHLHAIGEMVNDTVLGVLAPVPGAWTILKAFAAKTGQFFSSDEIEANQAGSFRGVPRQAGLGALQVTVPTAIAVSVVALSAVGIVWKLCERSEASAKLALQNRVLDLIAQKILTPEQGATILGQATEHEKASSSDSIGSTLQQFGTVLKWAVVGSAIVGGLYLVVPLAKNLLPSPKNA